MQALHAIAMDEWMISNPNFYSEYLALVDQLIDLLRELTKKHSKLLSFSGLTEHYDRASKEAFLLLQVADDNNSYQPQIYLHKDAKFVIGNAGSGVSVSTANQAIRVITSKIQSCKWI